MILYFSGTGNSRYAARLLGRHLSDDVVSINERLHAGTGKGELNSPKPWIFVCPAYAWRIPRVVRDFIMETTFTGSREAYFIMTCGGSIGSAERYIRKLCSRKNFTLMGTAEIIMPENYIALYEAPDKPQADLIIRRAVDEIKRITGTISARKQLSPPKGGISGWIKSVIINPFFYSFIVSARGFRSTDRCNGCGRCVDLCPLNNVALSEEKPVWGNSCTHCMACICGCPQQAIEYGNKTPGKARYYITLE